MKKIHLKKIAFTLGISSIGTLALGLGLLAFDPAVVAAPLSVTVVVPAAPVVVAPPVVIAPVPPAPVLVPDSYVWDGYEYVGIIGGQYFYLGAGNVWLACDPVRLARFQGWKKVNPDWRTHATRNVHYRTDHSGHVQQKHDEH
jgi:hypothetical protein